MAVLTVRDLNVYIRDVFDNNLLLTNLWVKGEISNIKQSSAGHIYFTLKDQYSTIKTVMFRSKVKDLTFVPENGMSVRVRGYVSVYEKDGVYQLYAQELEPQGAGDLFMAFEQLKQKLKAEGLFAVDSKKRLPPYPKCIGIVTSPTGSVIRDMLHILGRRWPGLSIVLVPVAVQGYPAAAEIARGINMLNKLGGVDVIIVGRGGGSLEELWAFNTEVVARSIWLSEVPVISAVGHETDYTISDMVADLRAPTPSAAAEIVVPVKRDVKNAISYAESRMVAMLADRLKTLRAAVQQCSQRPAMKRAAEVLCGARQMYLDNLQQRLERGIALSLERQGNKFNIASRRLNDLSPLAALSRGYCICTGLSGGIVVDNREVNPGQGLKLKLARGSLLCRVEQPIED